MSKESKDDILLGKIKAAKRKTDLLRNGAFLGFILLAAFGMYWLYLVANPLVGAMVIDSRILFFITLSGASLLLITIIFSIQYNRQNKGYYKELTDIPKQLRSSTVCPVCKKNLPKEYEAVCIFCGFNLGID